MSSVVSTTVELHVAQPKETFVEEWRLLETFRGDRHLVGRFSNTGRYWATSPIVRLDSASGTAFTSDGQRFRLVGEPGAAVAAASFVSLCAVFDERLLTTKDVTEELIVHAAGTSKQEVCLASHHH